MHIRLIPHYIMWHYTKGIHDVCIVLLRVFQSLFIIFSFRHLFATFFQPFERLGESYNGFHHFFETFIVNTLMRMVGMIVRTCLLLMGTVALACAVLFAIASLIIWCIAPVVVVVFIYVALITLIKVI